MRMELGVFQALSLLESGEIGNANSIILKNDNVIIVNEQAISQIGGTSKLAEFYRALAKTRQNSKSGRCNW